MYLRIVKIFIEILNGKMNEKKKKRSINDKMR